MPCHAHPALLASRKAAHSVKLLADGAKEALDNRLLVEAVPLAPTAISALLRVPPRGFPELP